MLSTGSTWDVPSQLLHLPGSGAYALPHTLIGCRVRSGPLEHKNMLLLHMESLGLRVNQEKSILTPNKRISFIGLTLDIVFLKAYLSAKQVKAFLACLARFCRENLLTFRTCLQLLGLMALAISWVVSLRLDCSHHRHCQVRVLVDCVAALNQWKRPIFFPHRGFQWYPS